MRCSLSLILIHYVGSCPFHSGMHSSLHSALRSASPDSQLRECSSTFHVSSLNPPSQAAPLRCIKKNIVLSSTMKRYGQMGIRYPASPYRHFSIIYRELECILLSANFPQKRLKKQLKRLLGRLIKKYSRWNEKK